MVNLFSAHCVCGVCVCVRDPSGQIYNGRSSPPSHCAALCTATDTHAWARTHSHIKDSSHVHLWNAITVDHTETEKSFDWLLAAAAAAAHHVSIRPSLLAGCDCSSAD